MSNNQPPTNFFQGLKEVGFYSFYMEVGKVIQKAKSDNRFKKLDYPITLANLEDGMFVSDHRLLFVYDGDWILIHGNQAGYPDTLQATTGIRKVLEKYSVVLDNKGILFRGRLMKSYFHIFIDGSATQPTLLTAIKKLTLDHKQLLMDSFETFDYKVFTPTEWEKFFINEIAFRNKSGVWFQKVGDAFTIMVSDECGDGLNINFGDVGKDKTPCGTMVVCNKNKLDIFEFYQMVTGIPISNELKQMISLFTKDTFVYGD